MKSIFIFALVVCGTFAYPSDVFRYEDGDTKHYMTGEPGTQVSGGWAFKSPEGQQYEMTYKADDEGFQPIADYIPLQVDDTNEVAESKAAFYSLFEEAKKRAEEQPEEEVVPIEQADNAVADDIDVVRLRREEIEAEIAEAAMEMAEEKLVEEDKAEARMTIEEESVMPQNVGNYFYFNQMRPQKLAKDKFVFHPYYGYIPVPQKKAMDKEDMMEEKTEKPLYIYHPYNGYIPVSQMKSGDLTGLETKYEFNPYYGFVPVQEKKEEMKDEKIDGDKVEVPAKQEKMVFHPYFGLISVENLKEKEKMEQSKKYIYDPMYGFIPEPQEKKAENEKAMEEMDIAKEEVPMKDDAEKFVFNPYYGFISTNKLKDEKIMKGAETEKRYVLHPYYGFIPDSKFSYDPFTGFLPAGQAKKEEEEIMQEEGEMMAAEEAKEKKEEEKFVYHSYFGFVPVSKLKDQKMIDSVNMKKQFILHPYYGFIPETNVPQKKVLPFNTYNYNPYFYPYNPYIAQVKPDAEKTEVIAEKNVEPETKEVREKRSAQYYYPTYQYPTNPVLFYSKPQEPEERDFTVPASTQILSKAEPYQFNLPPKIIPSLINKPIYYIPQAPTLFKSDDLQEPAKPLEDVVEVTRADEGKETKEHTDFPVVPVGAAVAQDPLPEKLFPLFPYDKDQDEPAALSF